MYTALDKMCFSLTQRYKYNTCYYKGTMFEKDKCKV